jgi:hypothetical protein
MQHADEGEQAPGGVEINFDLAGKPVHQGLRAFIVQAAAAHIDGLNLAWRRVPDRLVIALADHVIITDHAPERGQREDMGDDRPVVFTTHRKDEAAIHGRNFQLVGSAFFVTHCAERVLIDQIEDRDCALVLDIGRRAADGIVEFNIDKTRLLVSHRALAD